MRLTVAIILGIVVVMLLGGCTHYRTQMLRNERHAAFKKEIDDFKMLFEAYNDKPTATNIDELIQILATRGEKLNNPYQKDPSKPCYRLVIFPNQADFDPNAILIEETNTITFLGWNLKPVLLRDGTVEMVRVK